MTIDFNKVEFNKNPEPRCPCVLLLDTSGSMSGKPIEELNQGLRIFRDALLQDDLALLRVDVAIITFGPVQVIQDFVTANQFEPPNLVSGGDTPMGTAINLALDKIDERKQVYKDHGISYYRPWIFLITDGGPTDGVVWVRAAERVKEWEAGKKAAFFAIGIAGADMNVLGKISSRQPLKLQGLNFREMFNWLSSSLTNVSRSQPGDEVALQTPMGWASV